MGLMKAAARMADGAEAFDFADLAEASLTDPDPAQRRRAVQALAGEPDTIETLIWLLRGEADNSVRQAAFTVLAATEGLEAARGVATLLTDPDPALRNGAFETLAARPEEAAAMLVPLSHHADPDVRSFAVLLAAGLPGHAGAPFLIELAARETEPNVCAHLAEALGGSGAPEAGAALATLRAHHPDCAFIGFAVDLALRRLGDA